MSGRYPSEDVARIDQQFAETSEERRARRVKRNDTRNELPATPLVRALRETSAHSDPTLAATYMRDAAYEIQRLRAGVRSLALSAVESYAHWAEYRCIECGKKSP